MTPQEKLLEQLLAKKLGINIHHREDEKIVLSQSFDVDYGANDILHEDGSKSYYIHYADKYIKIERAEVVKIVEDILAQNFYGWGYMPTLNKLLESGKITEKEYNQIVRILD